MMIKLTVPGRPSLIMQKSWPGILFRRVSQPSIHLPDIQMILMVIVMVILMAMMTIMRMMIFSQGSIHLTIMVVEMRLVILVMMMMMAFIMMILMMMLTLLSKALFPDRRGGL